MADTGSMTGKTVLITGGTGGIGRAAAIALSGMGARVGITGHDRGRAVDAAAAITRETGNPAVDIFVADMSSQAEVRRLAIGVLAIYPRLDVLLNNVGGFWAHRHLTADGLEHTFALNHLAPFLLTNLLLDRLVASSPARVLTVSSGAHSTGKIDFDDLMGERNYSGSRAYNQSKLANVMFTYELAKRLEGTGVTANALHPGLTNTGFSAEDPALGPLVRLMRPFMRSPAKGADTAVYLASRHRSRASRGGTSPTGWSRSRARPPTTPRPPPGCGRSAPIWSGSGSIRPAETARRRDYGIGRHAWPRRIASATNRTPSATNATLISITSCFVIEVRRQVGEDGCELVGARGRVVGRRRSRPRRRQCRPRRSHGGSPPAASAAPPPPNPPPPCHRRGRPVAGFAADELRPAARVLGARVVGPEADRVDPDARDRRPAGRPRPGPARRCWRHRSGAR